LITLRHTVLLLGWRSVMTSWWPDPSWYWSLDPSWYWSHKGQNHL